MTFEFTIDTTGIEREIESRMTEIKTGVQDSMANAFATMIHQNFGADGSSRPAEWLPLTSKYAIAYHDGDTTPTLILSGDLQASIQITEGNPEFSEVFTNNEYAAKHQWGDRENNLPARPFFPITSDGELTPQAMDVVVAAANLELERQLKQI